MSVALLIGRAQREITPTDAFRPQWLDGFGNRDRPAEGSYLPLSVRALGFQQGGSRALLISAEVCALSLEQARRIKLRLAMATGLPPSAIMLTATHTHCAPRVGGLVMPGEADSEYRAWFEDQVVAVGEGALAETRPAMARVSIAQGTLGINRRGFEGGRMTMRSNSAGRTDPLVRTLWLDDADGDNLASLTTYACHPTSRGGYLMGGDYPGFLLRELDRKTGGLSLFALGCAGDQRPNFNTPEGRFRQAEPAEVEAAGVELAAAVLAGRVQASEVPAAPLQTAGCWVPLPLRPPSEERELTEIAANDPAPLKRDWARLMLSRREQAPLPRHADFEVQALHLGPGLTLIFWAGEMVVDYALWLAEATGSGTVFPIGYSNGSVGYVPSRRIYPEGGYEVDGSYYYYGQPAPFERRAEDVVRLATGAVLQ